MNFVSHLRPVALAALVVIAHSAQSATLDLVPSTVLAPLGASFSLDVNGNDFAGNIIGGGFNFSYDPLRLQYDGLVIDTTVWPDPARSAGLHDPASGTVTGVFFNNISAILPTGSFHVARLSFTSLSSLPSTVQLAGNPGLVWGNELAEEVAVNYGLAQINPVPEPGTWALMVAGMAMVGARRLRKS
ncbi:putative PEP-CTERM exosortase interaction domain-containing protein [Rubrivivax sp. A210]|uniref:PEP-CTERM sorting domain-containing protein n=1 Tax=Rubrivivax sp. A210 TaxID=2772301 RepID=UPI00191ACBE5|nr:PEP-CTERM sorting domain-containing protein [Rubrivivax sp. A210]CAD5373784.1 putative PEP-CTERM exosortase interaction domain-containing protein [Rubrivivax sp. A210]